MDCHIQCFEETAAEFSLTEKLPTMIKRNLLRLYRIFRKAKSPYYLGDDSTRLTFSPLNLQPGEKVRVKPLEEIKKTLNKDHKCQGLSFFSPMEKFCGGTYFVCKRVEKIFNERKWKMSKIKDVVLLEGVFCDGVGGAEKMWDGCDRSCYLWWKEAWLERVTDNENK
jgi:hypothetical protein